LPSLGGVVRRTVAYLVLRCSIISRSIGRGRGRGCGWGRWRRRWWNVWRGDGGDAMTCRCCCRMPADGSRKKDYRAGPCKMAPARDPSGGLKHNVAGHSGSKLHRLHRLHGLHRVHLSNSPAPPSASLPLRPSAPTPPSTQSRTRSGGFDVPPASSQASLKRVFHASPGAAHVWARWKLPHSGPVRTVVNSRELHGMLPRSTRDKAGGRRTRHCSEWRGEGSEGM
jgi:hypothetical protein